MHVLYRGTKCCKVVIIIVVIPLRYRTHSHFALKKVKGILMVLMVDVSHIMVYLEIFILFFSLLHYTSDSSPVFIICLPCFYISYCHIVVLMKTCLPILSVVVE